MNVFKIYPSLILVIFGFLASSCGTNGSDSTEVTQESDNLEMLYSYEMPDVLKNAIDSIGGIIKWNSYGSISYDLKSSWTEDHQLIDLKSRRLLIQSDSYSVGYNGEQVWITPSLDSMKNPRFYSSLFFYFLSIPYVFNDPGIVYQDLGTRELDGNEYYAIKISFESGVGDADKDEYIAHINPKTGIMEWLLYTVTYHDGERKTQYNALNYTEWNETGGLLFSEKLIGYHFKNDSLGGKRYEAIFSNIELSSEQPDDKLFDIPKGADIDSLTSS